MTQKAVAYMHTGPESPAQSFRYIVKSINPKRRGDVITRTWHNVQNKFTSPDLFRQKIAVSFAEQVPDSDDFSIGYYEKPGNSKRWIASSDDLEYMYSTCGKDDTITLWCDARVEGDTDSSKKKCNSQDDSREEATSKRTRKEKDIEGIFETLREKHSVEEFSDPQLRLWARMYANVSHSDLDHPPQVPAITGRISRQKEGNKSLTETLAGAATAVTKILVPNSPSKLLYRKPDGISPASKANLSGQYLQQLCTLQQLRDDKTLTKEKFQEQNHMLLENIKGLNN